jgi:hypothetical protein
LAADESSSSVPHPSFSFGGKQGTTLCTVAFCKTTDDLPASLISTTETGQPNRTVTADSDGQAEGQAGAQAEEKTEQAANDDLYICIDVRPFSTEPQ